MMVEAPLFVVEDETDIIWFFPIDTWEMSTCSFRVVVVCCG